MDHGISKITGQLFIFKVSVHSQAHEVRVVRLRVLRLVSAPACRQIQENLHGLIEKLLFKPMVVSVNMNRQMQSALPKLKSCIYRKCQSASPVSGGQFLLKHAACYFPCWCSFLVILDIAGMKNPVHDTTLWNI